MKFKLKLLRAALVVFLMATPLPGIAEETCSPCVGIVVGGPAEIASVSQTEPLVGKGQTLYVAWDLLLEENGPSARFSDVTNSGATPWVRAVLTAPQPVLEHLADLEKQLETLASLVKSASGSVIVQVVWRPAGGETVAEDYAFVVKRASVAVTGASPDAALLLGPFDRDPQALDALYSHEVAAYVDGVVFESGDGLEKAIRSAIGTDPGKMIAVTIPEWNGQADEVLLGVARSAAAGATTVLFDASSGATPDLGVFKTVASEFAGSLTYESYAAPRGGVDAWSFVREDLGLRVIAESEEDASWLRLSFSGGQVQNPVRVDPGSGEATPLKSLSRSAAGQLLTIEDPGGAVLLRLDRPAVADIDAFDEQIEVGGERQMPVEEVLRRLQAFEDDQDRRLSHYQAVNSLHLRFQAVRGAFEASYSGDYFYRRDKDFDWVWKDFFVGGVKWRSKRLPEVPLIQPEKATAMPVEILFTKEYDYRLRGTAEIDGRDCWVIDFKPNGPVEPGSSLFRGTVWVDREVYARVRTRAVQLGLEGEVVSNEETVFFEPVGRSGEPAPWSRESFVLPVRTRGQQVLSVLSVTLPIERETHLKNIRINNEGFAMNREAALDSDLTMVRDTDDGLRYLRKTKEGGREVESEIDTSRVFLLGGLFWDESLDFPLPLAGLNYLDLDFRDWGAQLNVFFAGAYLNVALSDPEFFGSRWNAGFIGSGLFFKTTDELYRDGKIVDEEAVKNRSSSATLFAGRPIGSFLKLDLRYRLDFEVYDRGDDTAEDFVLPEDTLTHRYQAGFTYARSGYRLGLSGSYNTRSDWDFWGLPGNEEYDPEQKDYVRWQVTLSKTWWFDKFRQLGLSLEHLDGSHLDRFSGYDFGLFGDSTVAGYQSGLVRAQKADGAHLSYGLNWLDQIGFEVEGDVVWASNELTGLDNELLAGIGLEGSFTLPWQLAVNFEIGYALAGPGEGNVAARIFFLKLFSGK